jgi:O-antigen/teichoic acid export membrane protein
VAVAEFAPPREDSVARNTLFSFLTQMTTAAGTAVLTLYLVRALGPHQFGVFALAVGIGTLLLIPSDFGITQSAARFIAERRGDPASVTPVLADAFRMKMAIGAATSGLLIALAGPIASAYGEPTLAWPIRWMAVAVLAQSMMAFYRYAYGSLRQVALGFKIVAGESFAETCASIAIVVAVGGAAAAGAGRAVGYATGLAIALILTLRRFGRPAFRASASERSVARRRLARYAGALLIIDAAFALSAQVAPLMIGAFLSAKAVGFFQAPARLIVFLQYPGLSVANAVGPGLARREGHEPDVASFAAALRYMVVFQGLLMAPVIVWAEPITRLLLGPGFAESAHVLRALAPYIFFSGLAALAAFAVNYIGEARLRVPISLLDVALGIGLTAALLPAVGLLGAAIAGDVAACLYVPLHLWICRRRLGMSMRPLYLAALRTLLAAGAMSLVLLAFGTGAHLAPLAWIGGAVLGLAAFLAVIVLTGEISVRDLRAVAGAVRSRLPQRA